MAGAGEDGPTASKLVRGGRGPAHTWPAGGPARAETRPTETRRTPQAAAPWIGRRDASVRWHFGVSRE